MDSVCLIKKQLSSAPSAGPSGPSAGLFRHTRRAAAGAVRAFVDEAWVLEAERCRAAVEKALPDTSAEIYFNLGPLGRHEFNERAPGPLRPRSAWVVGPRVQPILVAKETRNCDIVGIRVRAGVAGQLLGVPVHELQGTLVDLDCLWGAEVELIREQLSSCTEPARRMKIVETAILARGARGRWSGDAARARVLCASIGALTHRTVADLARDQRLSHRQMIALFDRHVGLKPKQYDRIQRLRRVLHIVHTRAPLSWAQVAVRCGFFDQAHMIHEFRDLAGMTPTEYEARRMAVGPGFVPHVLAPP